MTEEQQNEQLRAQYKAVAHLARSLADTCDDMIPRIGDPRLQNIVVTQGERSHVWMNILGDVLNGIDAVDDSDVWIDSVYGDARKIFPLVDTSTSIALHPETGKAVNSAFFERASAKLRKENNQLRVALEEIKSSVDLDDDLLDIVNAAINAGTD